MKKDGVKNYLNDTYMEEVEEAKNRSRDMAALLNPIQDYITLKIEAVPFCLASFRYICLKL